MVYNVSQWDGERGAIMTDREKTQQKTVRFPENQIEWIMSLEPKYGKDFANRVINLLEIGREKIEQDKKILEQYSDQKGESSTGDGGQTAAS